MSTLTLIQTSRSPKLELTAEALIILQRADMLICDTGTHDCYLSQITDECSTIELDRFKPPFTSVGSHIPLLDAEAEHIVVLWNQDTRVPETLNWMKGNTAQAVFNVDATIQIDSRIPSLSGIPIEQASHSDSCIFVRPKDWTTAFRNALARCPVPPSALIFSGFNVDVEYFTRQLSDWVDIESENATHISVEKELNLRTYLIKDLVGGDSMEIKPSDILIIGGRLNNSEFYAWLASRPLFGRRFMLTRSVGQQQVLHEQLAMLGAQTVALPVNELNPLHQAIQQQMYGVLQQYDWIIFTSVNAVHFFFEGLNRSSAHIDDFSNAKIACVGPATAAAVRAHGLNIDLQPLQFTSEGLVESFAQHDLAEKRILLPRAQVARQILPKALKSMNAQVDVIATYHKQAVPVDAETWNKLNAVTLDGVLFCASSAVIALESWIDSSEEIRFKHSVPAFCIGPSTRQTALSMNYVQVFTATEHTRSGLVDCITRHCVSTG